MTKSSIIVIGSGGHAKSIIDLIRTNRDYKLVGLIGKTKDINKDIIGCKVIGSDQDLEKIRRSVPNAVVAVGQIKNVKLRKNIFKLLKKYNYHTPKIISKYSYISDYSSIGDGTCVGHHVVINAAVKIGNNCILNSKCLKFTLPSKVIPPADAVREIASSPVPASFTIVIVCELPASA